VICSGVDNNTLCYGNTALNVTYFDENMNASNTWSVGSQANINTIQLIKSSAISAESASWGIGYAQLASNDPAMPSSRFIVLGDVLLENALSTDAIANLDNLYITTSGDAPCTEAINALVIQPPQNTELSLTVNSVPMQLRGTTVIGQTNGTTDNPMFVTSIDGELLLYPNTEREARLNAGQVVIAVLSADPSTEAQPLIAPDGQAVLRQIPVTAFTTPLALDANGHSIWGLAYYQTLTQLPQTLLNYPITVVVPSPIATPIPNTDAVIATPPPASDTLAATPATNITETPLTSLDITLTSMVSGLTLTPQTPTPASELTDSTQQIHTIQAGETAYRIAQTYGITVDELLSANGMTDGDVLYIGQELVIP
jgi:LysM repeat protein